MRHAHPKFQGVQDADKRIPEDEPVFLLRAQDEIAAETVRHWADTLESVGGSIELADKARRWAKVMANWPVKKVPD